MLVLYVLGYFNRNKQNSYAALTSSHVMTAPRTDKLYKLYTDACDYAVGAIL